MTGRPPPEYPILEDQPRSAGDFPPSAPLVAVDQRIRKEYVHMVLRSNQVLSRYRQRRRFIQRPGALTRPFTLLAPEVSSTPPPPRGERVSTGGVCFVGYKQCISRYVAMAQRGPRIYRSFFPVLVVARMSGFNNPFSRAPASLPAAPALSGTAALEGGGHGERRSSSQSFAQRGAALFLR